MTSGIYCIKNSVDGKVYIGKSINIERRIGEHKRSLVKDICGKDINRHLYNAVKKYGIDSFSFDIIDCVSSEEDLTDREMYWMIKCDSTNREFGYNLRLDSSTRCYVHPETKRLKNCFEQYSRDGILLKVWDSVFEIIENNPTYKWQNIYSVCNGYKKTYMGYIWKKKPKK